MDPRVRVTLFMAMSVNGVIARPDFREDFLSRANWQSFLACVRETGALIWGRTTHEKVRKYGPQYFSALGGFRNVVVSTTPGFTAEEPGFEVARSPSAALEQLRVHRCERATVAGGSILNSAFASAGLIDDVVLNVESVVIGDGIPLFAPAAFDLRLRLHEVRRLDDRIVQLRYAVQR